MNCVVKDVLAQRLVHLLKAGDLKHTSLTQEVLFRTAKVKALGMRKAMVSEEEENKKRVSDKANDRVLDNFTINLRFDSQLAKKFEYVAVTVQYQLEAARKVETNYLTMPHTK
ncbi:hypothetical protein PoB_000320600 [Plakobranchus ocellatus]|uniref:Uncharacterized protein n=1 Tax=Plakobranchus ocellatus TaxID=259542 RepID=A0AAV3XHB5_9GAST|nr:hypothetical protein PoB_000320600 [Plakobranchus ocellatus]